MAKEFTYKVNLDAETGQLTNKLKIVNDQLANLGKSGAEPGIGKSLLSLNERLDELKSKTSTPIRTMAAFGPMEKDLSKIGQTIQHLIVEFEALKKEGGNKKLNVLPPNTSKNILTAAKALDTYNNAIERSEKTTDTYIKAQKRKLDLENRYADLVAKIQAVEEARDEAAIKKTEAEKNRDAAKAGGNPEEIESTSQAYRTASSQVSSYTKSLADLRTQQTKLANDVKTATTEFEAQAQVWRNSKTSQQVTAFQSLVAVAREVGVSFENLEVKQDGFLKRTPANIQELKARLQELVDGGMVQADAQIDEINRSLLEMNATVEESTKGIEREAQAFREQDEAAGEVQGILSRIKQFTGLTGAALIMRRSLQSAFNTIKELDKQMTEMAVVTDLGVSDYWNQLPEHTERANELGLAIKDVYEAETLYYQQGLKAAEVTALSTSTLKMARIAGLSAEDATNKMTAALRGFNMELNQTNGDRIADVYSKLAAITASDVEEISTAMTKTASIASNAGMEFETTAAFLAQIIETTRESAETAGTAMKTVIARFQELKKAPEEIGEVDGEIVDANKIETALRTVGVALRDSEGQFRKLDEVFIDLASKWDSLDMNTQRYIATIAAGSRQQSRFVAMMSNYARTQELVNAANMAAGASNEQFEKTLDSLQSKLAALKNAWDTFTMGLANNEFIKGAVQALTSFMNLINKVTSGFDSWSSSVLKIGVVTGALVAGDKAVKAFTMSMGESKSILTALGAAIKAPGVALKDFIVNTQKSIKVFGSFKKSTIATKTATTEYTQAAKKLKEAIEAQKIAHTNAQEAEKDLRDIRLTGTADIGQLTKVEQGLNDARAYEAKSTEDVDNALASYAKTLGLTIPQAQAAVDITNLGVAADSAAFVASQGITASMIEQTAATMKLSAAEVVKIITGQAGAKTQLGGWIASKLMTLSLKLQTKGTYGQIIATKLQTIANWALKASTWELVVVFGLLLAAIIAIVATVILLVKAFQNIQKNSPAGQLNAANKALQEATKRADAAKEAYDDLADAFSSLKDQYKAFEDLTMGTQEWRSALLEVNGQVLDLLDKYPELAAYVSNVNGVLTIQENGFNALLAAQSQFVAQAQSAQAIAQMTATQAQVNYNYSQLSKDVIGRKDLRSSAVSSGFRGAATGLLGGNGAGLMPLVQSKDFSPQNWGKGALDALGVALGGPIGGAVAGAIYGTQQERDQKRGSIDALAMAYVNGTATEKQLKEIGELSEEAAKELREYGLALMAAHEAQKVSMQSMIDNALAFVDTSKYTKTQLEQMSNIGTGLMSSLVQEIESDNSRHMVQDALKELGKATLFAPYAAVQLFRGERSWVSNEEQAYWEGMYGKNKVKKNLLGKIVATDENGNKIKIDAAEAQAQYAAAQATKVMADKMQLLTDVLTKSSTAMGSLNRAYRQDEGAALTRADLDVFKDPEKLKTLWEDNEEIRKIYGDTAEGYDAFVKEISKRTELANNAFAQNRRQLRSLGIGEDFQFNDTLSAGAEKGLVEHLTQAVYVSGVEEAQKLGETINQILGYAADNAEREKIVSAMNAINWHDADALEELPTVLKEIGINLPTEALEALINQAKEAADALHKVDFTKLNEQLGEINQTLKSIQTANQGRLFSQEDYEELTKLVPNLSKDFRQNLEGQFVYLGHSLSDILDAVIEKADERVQEGAEVIGNKINTANILDNIIQDGNERFIGGRLKSFETASSWTFRQQKSFIEEVIATAKTNNIDLTGVSDYLSNDTEVSKLSKEAATQIITDLRNIYKQQGALQLELDTDVLQSELFTLLRGNPYFTARSTGQEVAQRAQSSDIGQLTRDEIIAYRGQREGTLTQAIELNIPEPDLKQMRAYHQILEDLEDAGATGTKEYKQYAKAMNLFMRQLGEKASYQVAYEGIKENVAEQNELMEAYKATTQVREQQFLVSQMMSKFDILVTEQNYEKIAAYTNAWLHGQEQGFENIINMAGVAAGIINDTSESIYERMDNANVLKEMDDTMRKFAYQMQAMNYGFIDAHDVFHWMTGEMINEAAGLVDAMESWQSPYDWIYNANQRINATMRARNRLEQDYQLLLDDHTDSFESLTKNLSGQLDLLQKEAQYQEEVSTSARDELNGLLSDKNGPYAQLLKGKIAIGPNGRITLDKDALYTTGYNEGEGEAIEAIIDRVETLVDRANEAEDSLVDIRNRQREIAKTGKEQYTSLIDRVTDALKQQYQRQIDTMQSVHDAVTDAANKMVDKMQEKIDDDRQARQDAKTREALSDKQAEIAYLEASGSSQLEVLKAEKELADQSEAYTDNLVDRSISDLQRANEAAAEQRQEQIDIAQAQYNWWAEHDAIHDAEQVLNQSLIDIQNGVDPINTNVSNLLSSEENVKAQTKEGVADWYASLKTDADLAAIHLGITDSENGTNALVQQLKDQVGGTKTTVQDSIDAVKQNQTTTFGEESLLNDDKHVKISDDELTQRITDYQTTLDEYMKKYGPQLPGDTGNDGDDIVSPDSGDDTTNGEPKPGFFDRWRDTFSNIVESLSKGLKVPEVESTSKSNPTIWEIIAEAGRNVLDFFKFKFASGGLADFTGPAWLDGTTAAPELVLNATDTANFIELKNLLADAFKDGQSTTSLGNNYYDIDVHVDNIDSDYDIDSAAAHMKELIEAEAMYRNVNAIQRTR